MIGFVYRFNMLMAVALYIIAWDNLVEGHLRTAFWEGCASFILWMSLLSRWFWEALGTEWSHE